MPYVTSTNSTVRQIVQCGNTMYAVGSFSTVAAAGVSAQTRHNAFSFNATTGAISTWNPNPNGEVNSIALSADCATAYLGGTFSTVQGHAVKYLAKVSTATGAPVTTFAPAPNGGVNTARRSRPAACSSADRSARSPAPRGTRSPRSASTTGAIDPYVESQRERQPAEQQPQGLQLRAEPQRHEVAGDGQLPHRGRRRSAGRSS